MATYRMPEFTGVGWGVEAELAHVGDQFAEAACGEGADRVMWYFGFPDEQQQYEVSGSIPPDRTLGGMTKTQFWMPMNAHTPIFNRFSDEIEQFGDDGQFSGQVPNGILIGTHVCMAKDADGEFVVLDDGWESDEPEFHREGGVDAHDTIAYDIEQVQGVPPDLPLLSPGLDPLEEIGLEEADVPEVEGVSEPDVEYELTELSGIGEAVAADLAEMGVTTKRDLFDAFARDDEDVIDTIPPFWQDDVADQLMEMAPDEGEQPPAPAPEPETEPGSVEPTPIAESNQAGREPTPITDRDPQQVLMRKQVDVSLDIEELSEDIDSAIEEALEDRGIPDIADVAITDLTGVDTGNGSQPWADGQQVLMTMPDCVGCEIFKEDDEVQDALASGELVEIGPDHPEWDAILADTDVMNSPAVVQYDATADAYTKVLEVD